MLEKSNKYHFNITHLILIIIFFIAMLLPYFVIPIVIGGGITYPWYFIFINLFLLYYIITKPSNLINKVKELYDCKATKVLLLFLLSQVILSIIHIILGNSSILKPFITLLFRITFTVFPLFFGYLLLVFFKSKTIIKVIFWSLYLIMLFGLIDFCIFYFDIEILKKIYFFFVNDRVLLKGVTEIKAYVGNLPRIQSTFVEPAFLAYFLNMHLPIIYNLSLSKYKIFKNNILNKFLKITLPILTWIVIIGMQSPIHLIFDILITIGYLIIKHRISLKKFLLFIVLTIIIIFILCSVGQIFLVGETNSPLQRLYVVFKSVTNFNLLIFAEPSLATRIGTYANEVVMFLKHPFIGCGIGNFVETFAKQIATNSPILLTEELIVGHILGNRAVNASILYSLLAELGIIATLIYYSFIYTLHNTIRKISKYTFGIEKDFLIGYMYFLILYIILSFYEAFFSYFWLEFGIILGFINLIKRRYNNAYINHQ